MKPIHNIFSSDGFSVRLTPAEKAAYDRDERVLRKKYALLEFIRRGIWAGNQNKYVLSLAELNDWDTVPMFAEEFLKEGVVPCSSPRDT